MVLTCKGGLRKAIEIVSGKLKVSPVFFSYRTAEKLISFKFLRSNRLVFMYLIHFSSTLIGTGLKKEKREDLRFI